MRTQLGKSLHQGGNQLNKQWNSLVDKGGNGSCTLADQGGNQLNKQ